jgi:hypothetical protein
VISLDQTEAATEVKLNITKMPEDAEDAFTIEDEKKGLI